VTELALVGLQAVARRVGHAVVVDDFYRTITVVSIAILWHRTCYLVFRSTTGPLLSITTKSPVLTGTKYMPLAAVRPAMPALDDAPAEDAADPETVTYQFDVPETDWREWTNTVPRETPLHARLHDLIRQDTESVQAADLDDEQRQHVRLVGQRVAIRSRQALQAIRGDDVDQETALDELETVIDLAEKLEG